MKYAFINEVWRVVVTWSVLIFSNTTSKNMSE